MRAPALFAVLAITLLTGCMTQNYQDNTDAARRRQIIGHWYDRYTQDLSYAQGDTHYRRDGTFTASYESVAPGTTADQPAQRETVQWSGKWRVENGLLIEDITATSDAAKTPRDRPLQRYIAQIDGRHLLLRNLNGNTNDYARKSFQPPKVTITPYDRHEE